MANTRSAEKNIRKTRARTVRNRATKNRIRTIRKKALAALSGGDARSAQETYNELASAADKAAKTKVIHKNAAARIKSRLALKFAKSKA